MHKLLGVLLLLSFVSSCGKSNSTAGLPNVKEKILPLNGSNIDGLYMAKFFTINPGVNGTLPGSATIQRQQDKFYAYVRLFGGAPNAWHQQNIYEGSRCPNAGDDKNKDGYIDIEEGNRVWGKVLIPLDSNLNSQSAGRNIFPVADATGTYFYERVSSFNKLFEDLRSEDKNISDNLVKLDPNKGFDIEGRVVVIQGTASTNVYPESVASSDNRPAHQTLPIACGVFSRVTSIPGEEDTGEIPGPVETPEVPTEEPGDVIPVPEEPIPSPEPVPTPTPVPDYHPEPRPDYSGDSDSDEQDDEWYDRVVEWWRDRWDRSRDGRRTDWGDGLRILTND